jgi:uncharacterized membrane protein YfcA
LRHREYGNVNIRLGSLIIITSIAGIEAGYRLLQLVREINIADEAVLIVAIVILLLIGSYMFHDSYRSIKQYNNELNGDISTDTVNSTSASMVKMRLKMMKPLIYYDKTESNTSLWLILGIGLLTGILSGFIGVGGGFVMVPSLIYLVGLPSYIAVGTSFFQMLFSAAYGSIRYTINGDVIIFAAFIMVLSSAFGVQIGVLATRLLKDICMKFILTFSIFIAIFGSSLKLANIFTEHSISILKPLEVIITFGGLGIIVIIITILIAVTIRFNKTKKIPKWFSLLVLSRE